MEDNLGAVASYTEELTVVLKNDPRVLPMVCGICGSQFSTGRGLEVHLRTHKIDRQKKVGAVAEKKPTVTRARREDSADATAALVKCGSTVDESGLRKSMRTPKRKVADEQYVYIYEVDADGELLGEDATAGGAARAVGAAEEEDDDGGGGVEGDSDWGPRGGTAGRPRGDETAAGPTRQKTSLLLRQPTVAGAITAKKPLLLPEFTKEGVPIARLEDYVKPLKGGTASRGTVAVEGAATAMADGALVSTSVRTEQTKQLGPVVDILAAKEVTSTSVDVDGEASDGAALAMNVASDHVQQLAAVSSSSGASASTMTVEKDAESIADAMEFSVISDAEGAVEEELDEEGRPVIVIAVTNGIIDEGDVREKACEVCLKVLSSSDMRQHMLDIHLDQKDFACPREGCSETFTDIADLRCHTRAHETGQPTVTCEVCGRVLSDAGSLRTHMKLKHGGDKATEDTGEQACEFCGKVFKNRRAHSSHMKKHTKPLDPSECDRCGRTFRHKTALKFHQKMNTDCDKSKYVCDICGYKGTSPWRLASHRSQVHSNERPFLCEMCPKTFKTREMMKLHMHKMHTGVPRLDCQMCGRKFFYKAELREHMQIHSDVKSFECPICQRTFKTMHVLRGHLSGKHSDTWYSCGFCKFTTSHKKSMKRHMVLVHKLTNVTLEVTPEEQRGIQVEVIPTSDGGEVQLHIPDAAGNIQYDEQLDSIVTTTVAGDEAVIGSSCSTPMDSVVGALDNAVSSRAVEVSEVLVALSGIADPSACGLAVAQ